MHSGSDRARVLFGRVLAVQGIGLASQDRKQPLSEDADLDRVAMDVDPREQGEQHPAPFGGRKLKPGSGKLGCASDEP